jgi:type IV pilus assembly protein PilW
MNKRFVVPSGQRGFTLIELLVASALASLVGMAAYTIFSNSSRSTVAQEDVTEAQQNVRVAMDVLSRDIRGAGFGLQDFINYPINIGGVNHSAPVVISNRSTGFDTITLVGIGLPASTLAAPAILPATCNQAGQKTICVNSLNDLTGRKYVSLEGIRLLEITGTNPAAGGNPATVAIVEALDRTYAPGTRLFVVQAIRYSLVANTSLTGCSAANPCLARHDLERNNQVVAQNIEDMQFAVSRKGSTDFINYPITALNDVSAVRASLVGRTRRPVIEGTGVSQRTELEDRVVGTVDNFRRRNLTTVIKVRNPPSSDI